MLFKTVVRKFQCYCQFRSMSKLVHEHKELRDGVNVEIHRYQAEERLNYGGSHITTITAQNGKYLLSYTIT